MPEQKIAQAFFKKREDYIEYLINNSCHFIFFSSLNFLIFYFWVLNLL